MVSPERASRGKVEVTTQRLPLIRLSDGDLPPQQELPERYRLREDDPHMLICLEAPTLQVRVERGLTVTAAAARSAPPGTIFLDGAAKGPPFLDTENDILNLDHHEGCVRRFTLSTCEQAFVLVNKGMDFQSREWTIVANEPDLDTLLAIWVLLNHRRVRKSSPDLLARLVPMIRLEGVIDVHGFDLRHFCGFPPDLTGETFALLEHVRREEADLKASGEWTSIDPVRYTRDQLHTLDRLLYTTADFEGLEQIEEIARAELSDQKLAIACRSDVGIYRVEEQLRDVYDERLGLIVLQKEPGHYTLRQSSAFTRNELDRVYERLNLLDPSAGNGQSPERWGGSSDIGGSPRGNGSRLSVQEIVRACRDACTPIRRAQAAATFAVALVASGAAAVLSSVPFWTRATDAAPETLLRTQLFSVGLLLLAATTLLGAFWRGPGLFGMRSPAGWAWTRAAPAALIGAALGGAWLQTGEAHWISLLGLALGAELLFRGVVYGAFQTLYAGHRGPRISHPLWQSTLVYALCSASPLLTLARPTGLDPATVAGWLAAFLGALVFGGALGWIRERSESLLPPMLVHGVVALLLGFAGWT